MSAGYFLHNDDPTNVDTLGRKSVVADLARRAATCQAPQVLGLHGDWGSGKTSILMQLQKELETSFDKTVTVVWFEAWRYQNEAAPIVALLHAMREKLDWVGKALAETKKLAEVTVRSALLHWGEITRLIGLQAVKIDAAKIQTAGETWEKEHLASKLPTQATTEILDQALEGILGRDAKSKKADANTAPTKRLIVIIDDLDRCNPESAFRLLEGIKIYLGLKRCVFILGINQREIERAIEKQIPAADKDDSTRARAKEYLDKLCGHIWRLPYIDPAQQASLVELLLKDAILPPNFINRVKGLVADYGCLPPNPRKIKRFTNALITLHHRWSEALGRDPVLYGSMANSDHPDLGEAQVLTLVACLDAFHPEFHRRIQQVPNCYESLLRWCQEASKLPETDPLAEVTKELQLTHSGGTSPMPVFYDPSSPKIFYPQRLLAHACGGLTAASLKPFFRL